MCEIQQKGLNMNSCVIPKDVYKKECEKHLETKRKEIAALEKKMQKLDPASVEYKMYEEQLRKANKKAQEYVQSIYMMDVQMNLQTNARFKGLPCLVTISGR